MYKTTTSTTTNDHDQDPGLSKEQITSSRSPGSHCKGAWLDISQLKWGSWYYGDRMYNVCMMTQTCGQREGVRPSGGAETLRDKEA